LIDQKKKIWSWTNLLLTLGEHETFREELSAKVLRFPHKHVIRTHHFIYRYVE